MTKETRFKMARNYKERIENTNNRAEKAALNKKLNNIFKNAPDELAECFPKKGKK